MEVLSSLSVEADADMEIPIPLVKQSLEQMLLEWLADQIDNLAQDSLSNIVTDDEIDITLRVAAARRLRFRCRCWSRCFIDLYSRTRFEARLADLLLKGDEQRCSDYPYETLLVVHLLPARTKGWNFDVIRKAMSCCTLYGRSCRSSFCIL